MSDPSYVSTENHDTLLCSSMIDVILSTITTVGIHPIMTETESLPSCSSLLVITSPFLLSEKKKITLVLTFHNTLNDISNEK